jgi:hypothetical protein
LRQRGGIGPLEQLEIGAFGGERREPAGVQAGRTSRERQPSPVQIVIVGLAIHRARLKRKGQHDGWPFLA